MKEYIISADDVKTIEEEFGIKLSFEKDDELIRCEDCKWGREISGNIECNVDINNPPEYHGYKWFCPCGEPKEEESK